MYTRRLVEALHEVDKKNKYIFTTKFKEIEHAELIHYPYFDLFFPTLPLRKQTKPMIIACNKIDIEGAYENFEKLKEQFPDEILIPCSAESELALKEAAKHELID